MLRAPILQSVANLVQKGHHQWPLPTYPVQSRPPIVQVEAPPPKAASELVRPLLPPQGGGWTDRTPRGGPPAARGHKACHPGHPVRHSPPPSASCCGCLEMRVHIRKQTLTLAGRRKWNVCQASSAVWEAATPGPPGHTEFIAGIVGGRAMFA